MVLPASKKGNSVIFISPKEGRVNKFLVFIIALFAIVVTGCSVTPDGKGGYVIGAPASQPATSGSTSATQAQTTTTPSAPVINAGTSCVLNQVVTDLVKAGDIGAMIIKLDELWDQSGGNIGLQSRRANWSLDNPGPAGASVVWTNTNHKPWQTPGKKVEENVFGLLTEGNSWGVFVTFSPVVVPSPGRSAELCEKVSDLKVLSARAVPANRTSATQ